MSNGNGNVLRKVDNDSGYTKIDNNIFKNRDLSLKAKGLLSMMLSFADGWEFSVSGLTKLSKDGIDSVRSGLNELEELGYIYREYPRDKGKFGKTVYHISQVPNLVGKTVKEKPYTVNPYTDKSTRKIQYNKELTNKVLTNKETRDKELTNTLVEQIPFKEIIEYLNLKANKDFRNVKGNQELIRARFNEGYTLEDFKKVIDNKCIDWLGNGEMEKYLQPSTLFNNGGKKQNFDRYLNEIPKNKPREEIKLKVKMY